MSGEISFLQAAESSSDTNVYTFSNQNIGTAANNRHIVVAVHGRDTGTGAKSISGVTVGGIAAAIVIQTQRAVTNSNVVGIAIAAVPAGTTGDVVVTFSESFIRCAIALYRTIGIDAKAYNSGTSIANDPSVNLNIPKNGVAVGAGSCGGVGSPATWTNLTEKYDADFAEGASYSGASDMFSSQQTGLAITYNPAVTTETVGVFVSWAPTQTISVSDYGADPTGVSDSSAAIRAAIVAAYNSRITGSNGGVQADVEFPVGVYKISDYLPLVPTVVLFCRVPMGATILPTGSLARAASTATLSGTTFTSNAPDGSGQTCGGCGALGLFISALSANCTLTDEIAFIGGAGESFFDVRLTTDIGSIDGVVLDHNVSMKNPRFWVERIGGTGGIGLTISGQTNANVFHDAHVTGAWSAGALMGGLGNAFLGGDFEHDLPVGVIMAGEGNTIDGTWFEGCATACIQLGRTSDGTTCAGAVMKNINFASAIGIGVDIQIGTSFDYQLSNRYNVGATYSSKFAGVASSVVCNGRIQVHGDPSTFSTADLAINLESKGAINIEVYGSNDGADKTRYGLFSTATNRPIIWPQNCAFLAYNSATDSNVTGNGAGPVTVDFDTEVFDRGGNFAADTFTAPVAGCYHFSYKIALAQLTPGAGTLITHRLVTSNLTFPSFVSPTGPDHTCECSMTVEMDAGDTATVNFTVTGMAGNTVDVSGAADGRTSFSGHWVG